MSVETGIIECGWCKGVVAATHTGMVRNSDMSEDLFSCCSLHLPTLRGDFGADLAWVRPINDNTQEGDMSGTEEQVFNGDASATVEVLDANGNEVTVNLSEHAAALASRFGSEDVGVLLDQLGFMACRSDPAAGRLWDGWAYDAKAGARRPTAEVTRMSWMLGWESVGTINDQGWKVGGWSVRVLMDPLTRDAKQFGIRYDEKTQRPQAVVMIAWETGAEPRLVQERRNGVAQFETLTNGHRVPKMVFDLDRKGRPWVDHTYDCFMHRTIVGPSAEAAYEAALSMAEEVGAAIQEHYDARVDFSAAEGGRDDQAAGISSVVAESDSFGEL